MQRLAELVQIRKELIAHEYLASPFHRERDYIIDKL